MDKAITIAGLEFELKFCKKINEKPLEDWEISRIPLANIYSSRDRDTYTVNILSHIPVDFNTIKEHNQLHIDLLPKEKNKLFFSYNGVSVVKTSIYKLNEGDAILCRNFSIDYDSSKEEPIKYDLYHIKLHYRIVKNDGQSVEAIIVHDKNFDPETSRGTVTTVRDDDN
jgi:hypothetical protein